MRPKARQTSEVPPWALLRTTNVHVSPPPVTLETVMFDDECVARDEREQEFVPAGRSRRQNSLSQTRWL